MKSLAFSIFIIFILCIGCGPSTTTIFVDNTFEESSKNSGKIVVPSIEDALEQILIIRENDKNTLINLKIKNGTYRLKQAIKVSAEDGPLNIIGEGPEKTIIKGSNLLQLEWTISDDNIWKSSVKEDFDQLYVNGKQQILARYPNYDEAGGHWQGHSADAISKERIKSWNDPSGAFVHAMHKGEWGGYHYLVNGKNELGLLDLNGGHQNNRPSEMHKTYRMVENVFEELDSPGEWYLDRNKGQLYYWPHDTTDINSAVVEGVQLKHLIEIKGTEDNPIKNISISDIKFEHSQRTFMEEYEPLLRSDWTIYRGAALFIENAENINIQDCEFTNLGGNVILVSKYNRNVTIKGNHIHECGASAISFIGDPKAVRSPSFQYSKYVPLADIDTIKGPKTSAYPSNCIIDNNLIYRIGRVEKQVAGVQISMSMKIKVSHNTIYEVPRSGINVSEGTWGGHIIEFNDVFNTVLETSDHGAFNSWGRDRFWHPKRKVLDKFIVDNPQMPKWDAMYTTIIRNNRFKCEHGWDIDLDDGSSNYNIYNNVCLNGGIKLREGFFRRVENNIMVNNTFHPHVWFEKSEDVFKHNIVMSKYKDIRLSGWGKEIDFNLFPDKNALESAQKNNTDQHSIFGDPDFQDSQSGIYTVSDSSPALQIGFKNIQMDSFGVVKQSLKSIAKSPDFPKIWTYTKSDDSLSMNWLGATLKNITSIEERSAYGLSKTAGVLIQKIVENSVAAKSLLNSGDVIIGAEGSEINGISNFMQVYQGHNWKGKINLVIYRNQESINLLFQTK